MSTIGNIFKVGELRSRILFTLAVLAVYRLGCVLTIPGVDAVALFEYFNTLSQQNNMCERNRHAYRNRGKGFHERPT